MTIRIEEDNKLIYGQDFSVYTNLPKNIDFFIFEYEKQFIQLKANGFGGTPYGNGMIYLYLHQFNKEEQNLLYDAYIRKVEKYVINYPRFITNKACCHEPDPIKNENSIRILDLVRKDLEDRAEVGNKKYGTYLMSHNGRDSLMDAYQEALDLVMYLRQNIYERENK